MARPITSSWNPTQLEQLAEDPFDTSMGPAKVKTNATFGYLKALGNRQGPHPLASEWVGTSLAHWFGLPVADFAIIHLEQVDCFNLPRGAKTQPGPAFISRHVPGRTWGKSADELKRLENPSDITRLVVFDTWVRNCDRHPKDVKNRKPNYANVYLGETENSERYRLYAIDHTHCFDCGGELTARLSDIDKVKDDGVYGLFPEFEPFITVGELAWCQAMLHAVEEAKVRQIVDAIPAQWEVSLEARISLVELIVRRAGYLADKINCGWGVNWWLTPEESEL